MPKNQLLHNHYSSLYYSQVLCFEPALVLFKTMQTYITHKTVNNLRKYNNKRTSDTFANSFSIVILLVILSNFDCFFKNHTS